MRFLELLAQVDVVEGRAVDADRRVGAGIAQVHLGERRRRAGIDALGAQFLAVQLDQFLHHDPQAARGLGRHGLLDGALAVGPDVGEAHAIGGEDAGEGVDQNGLHAERVGDQTGMLAAGAAEAGQRVAGDVVAALDRDLLDRVGHVLDRDGDVALGHFFRAAAVADLRRHLGEGGVHRVGIERGILLRPEDRGEEFGIDLAEHEVGVGDRQRSAAAVAFGAGIGTGAVRADPEARAVEMKDRPAAGGDRVDQHHRRAHAHARDLGLEGAFILAVIVGDVGRGAAHVEADHLVEAGHLGGFDRTDHAAGGAREDRVLALEQVGSGEAAGGLHEHELGRVFAVGARGRQLRGDLFDIAPQDRGEIGVDHRGVAPADQFHQGADLVADRDLGEAHVAGDGGDLCFVVVVAVAVHEDDGGGADAGVKGLAETRAGGVEVDRYVDRAVGADPFAHLDHALVEVFRFDDMAVEQARAGLIADLERVAEAVRGDEHRSVAGAFEQRVGGDRRAHLDRVDHAVRDRLARTHAQQVADALDRGVTVDFRVFRQELVRPDVSLRVAGHDVGEGAATVDPEIPSAARVLRHVALHWTSFAHTSSTRNQRVRQ